jgi:hypothetical protein
MGYSCVTKTAGTMHGASAAPAQELGNPPAGIGTRTTYSVLRSKIQGTQWDSMVLTDNTVFHHAGRYCLTCCLMCALAMDINSRLLVGYKSCWILRANDHLTRQHRRGSPWQLSPSFGRLECLCCLAARLHHRLPSQRGAAPTGTLARLRNAPMFLWRGCCLLGRSS